MALIILVLGGTGYVLLAGSLSRAATASVLAAEREAAEGIRAKGTLSDLPDEDVPSSSAIRVALFLPGGQVVGERGEIPSWLRPQPRSLATVHVLGEEVRVATRAVRTRTGGRGTLVVGRSLAPEDRLLARVRLLLWLGGGLSVLLSLGAGWILAGRAARPVRRAYEAQANFASDASHELRTPLAFIRSGVEVLAPHDPELGEEVVREVEYLTSLSDRLLTLARADSGRLALRTAPVELQAVSIRAVRRSARALGLEAEVRPAEPVMALADEPALEASLDAVLENVVRHGGGRAELACSVAQGMACLRVVDRGAGMDAEQRRQAFERFFRADQARSREQGGAGLGLPLARTLVEAQGGRLWLEEAPGGGTVAVFELRPG